MSIVMIFNALNFDGIYCFVNTNQLLKTYGPHSYSFKNNDVGKRHVITRSDNGMDSTRENT